MSPGPQRFICYLTGFRDGFPLPEEGRDFQGCLQAVLKQDKLKMLFLKELFFNMCWSESTESDLKNDMSARWCACIA
jgi:hypothetical protein